jgi:hypothetical protein
MRVFVTGATGWVGSVVADELLGAGHQVLRLSRLEAKAAVLAAKGADVLRSALDDLDHLTEAAADADTANHLAFDNDLSVRREQRAEPARDRGDGRGAGRDGSYIRLRDKTRYPPARVLGLSPTDPLGATGWQRPSQSRGECHNIRRRR